LAPSDQRSSRAAFRYPNFRYATTARFLSVASSEMQAVAVGWQIFNLTHRPLDLGLVGLAQFAPGIFLFLLAGHTADRVSRQRILLACYGGFSLCSLLLLALTLHGLTAVWPIYVVLLGNGVVRAFLGPASQAFLPSLVTEEHFPNAVAWDSSISKTAAILGPVAGGLLYSLAGSPVPVYSAAVVAYLTALLLASRIELRALVRPRPAASVAIVLQGLRYIWHNKLILGSISLDLFAVLLGGAVALLPVYASEILKTGPYGLGLLRSAPGAGAVLMALALARFPLRRRVGLTMFGCVFGFGAFTAVFGLSRNLVLSLLALTLIGGFDMVSVFVRQTLVQLATPDDMRGRVSAVNWIFIGASNELGQFESGITAQWFGTVPAVVLGGLGTIAIVLLWSWLFTSLRRVDELQPKPTALTAPVRN
jgi:MFS family permease